MNWKNFKEGLNILDKYIDGKEYPLDADHDVLFVGPPGLVKRTLPEDRAKLEELGWGIEDPDDCGDEDDQVWRCFT